MPSVSPPPLIADLMAASGSFGAGRLALLIVLVFLAIMATLIVPLELRLYRQRREGGGQPGQSGRQPKR